MPEALSGATTPGTIVWFQASSGGPTVLIPEGFDEEARVTVLIDASDHTADVEAGQYDSSFQDGDMTNKRLTTGSYYIGINLVKNPNRVPITIKYTQ